MKMITLAVSLLLTQAVHSETASSHAEDLEERASYVYPLFDDDTESISISDEGKHEQKNDSSKDESPSVWHDTVGKAKVTVDVENTDFLSQCQAEWDKVQGNKKLRLRAMTMKLLGVL